ncbi:5' nucleotidase, NT5C type [Tellurirhabdus rosea]|uniref:5' nucleotidase, NT5C type n=1 Tax=Tellurirhabdus rosea TaxID=2674997 RepID=UPI00224D3CF0|nr:5'(3')-deoxyribonucleotidase [Tellurirhabdus rosea]
MKPRIAIDMDDVLADTTGKFIDIYRRDFDPVVAPERFREKSFHELLDQETYGRLFRYVHDRGFFTDIEVMEGAIDVTRALMEKYDLFVTTAAMEFRNSFEEKYDWLMRHFSHIPWQNWVFLGDKSIIRAEYMIDDLPRNLLTFEGEGLLFHAPHNTDDNEFRRVRSWDEIAGLLL